MRAIPVIDSGNRTSCHTLRHFARGVQCVIGNGVVLEPHELLKEIDTLEGRGVPVRERPRYRLPVHYFAVSMNWIWREKRPGVGKNRRQAAASGCL